MSEKKEKGCFAKMLQTMFIIFVVFFIMTVIKGMGGLVPIHNALDNAVLGIDDALNAEPEYHTLFIEEVPVDLFNSKYIITHRINGEVIDSWEYEDQQSALDFYYRKAKELNLTDNLIQ